jgi:hypothetical protein
VTHRIFPLLSMQILAAGLLFAAHPGKPAEYLGGTLGQFKSQTGGRLAVSDQAYLVFTAKKQELRIPYQRINQLEYGQKVGRRIMTAVVVSPLFLLTKKRAHFLTIGYQDEEGRQQAMVFRIPKNDIRPLLVSLEARTGLRVEYQDEEARKAGKG